MTDAPPVKQLTENPPHTWHGIILRLGPGLIVAGSIVGSGELIATTKTGAEAGFWLLWLIGIGCLIKVFAQIEFGRYSIVNGRTTMDGLAEVPGPSIPGRGNWLVWFWFCMFLASLAQLGGIVGGVGQALAISAPLTQHGRDYNDFVDLNTQIQVKQAELRRAGQVGTLQAERDSIQAEIDRLEQALAARSAEMQRTYPPQKEGAVVSVSRDADIWAGIITVLTSVILMVGHYGLIQSFATAMVALFTLVTVVNLLWLQSNPIWSVTWTDLAAGMSFRLPPQSPDALGTALKTFGIIGVGASELVVYPYWCLEKGYARFAGPRDKSVEWGERARGWMRVMRWDAWCSMVVYTFATIAFYLLGAAILGRSGLNPEKDEMVRTLAVMYEPVFGAWAPSLFLFGAFAVLYSTFFVANASQARVFSDVLRVLGISKHSEQAYRRRVRFFSGLFPVICLTMYMFLRNPAKLILFSGLMQALMLPMLAGAALFFRYRRNDPRLMPGRTWDLFLWVSALGMLVAGGWALRGEILNLLQMLSS